MTALQNIHACPGVVRKMKKGEAEALGREILVRLGFPTKPIPTRPSFPAASSSEWHCPWAGHASKDHVV